MSALQNIRNYFSIGLKLFLQTYVPLCQNTSTAIKTLFLAWVGFSSCDKEITNGNEFVPSIVVDGRIENKDFPRVFLTRNIPYYVNIDSADIIYLVMRQAKVTVSDGENSEILTLTYDKNMFPPFYYTGTNMLGETGKTYDLRVEYGSTILTASTTIPEPVEPDSIWFQSLTDDPSMGQILMRLHDSAEQKNYYKMYTRIVSKQNNFIPTLISNFDDALFDGKVFTFHLNQGPESYLNLNQDNFNFSKNDTILLKICTLDKTNFAFWKSYQNEVTNGANPFASSFHKIESNIVGNGIGIWGGYGTNIYKVKTQ